MPSVCRVLLTSGVDEARSVARASVGKARSVARSARVQANGGCGSELTGTEKKEKAKNMHQKRPRDVSGACKRTVAAAVIVKGGRVWWSAVGRNGRLVLQCGREGCPTHMMISTADFVWGVRCALSFFLCMCESSDGVVQGYYPIAIPHYDYPYITQMPPV